METLTTILAQQYDSINDLLQQRTQLLKEYLDADSSYQSSIRNHVEKFSGQSKEQTSALTQILGQESSEESLSDLAKSMEELFPEIKAAAEITARKQTTGTNPSIPIIVAYTIQPLESPAMIILPWKFDDADREIAALMSKKLGCEQEDLQEYQGYFASFTQKQYESVDELAKDTKKGVRELNEVSLNLLPYHLMYFINTAELPYPARYQDGPTQGVTPKSTEKSTSTKKEKSLDTVVNESLPAPLAAVIQPAKSPDRNLVYEAIYHKIQDSAIGSDFLFKEIKQYVQENTTRELNYKNEETFEVILAICLRKFVASEYLSKLSLGYRVKRHFDTNEQKIDIPTETPTKYSADMYQSLVEQLKDKKSIQITKILANHFEKLNDSTTFTPNDLAKTVQETNPGILSKYNSEKTFKRSVLLMMERFKEKGWIQKTDRGSYIAKNQQYNAQD